MSYDPLLGMYPTEMYPYVYQKAYTRMITAPNAKPLKCPSTERTDKLYVHSHNEILHRSENEQTITHSNLEETSKHNIE